MKNLSTLLCVVFASCMATRPISHPVSGAKLIGKEPGNEIFVLKNNGEKISGSSFTYANHRPVDVAGYFHIDNVKVSYKDLKAYQDGNGYYAVLRDEKHKSGTLISRVRRGEINLYVNEIRLSQGSGNTHSTEYHYDYYFNKADNQITHVEYNNLENAISVNEKALDLLHNLFPKKKIPFDRNGQAYSDDGTGAKLIKVFELYNN